MSRLRVEIPETFHFSTKIPVLVQHINWGGHMGNDSYLSMIHEARARFLHSIGLSEKSLEGHVGLVLTDSYVKYQKESSWSDEIEIFVLMNQLTRLEADFYYKLVSIKTSDVIALAKTGCAFFNYEKRALAKLTQKRFESLQSKLAFLS